MRTRKKKSHTDNWETPDWLMRLFHGYYDPCPLGAIKTKARDDLTGTWELMPHELGVYCNPPYSNPKPWVEKAIRTHQKHGTLIVMLLKHDSSTQWYRMLKEAGARFLMIEGRLTYKAENSRPCAFPSVLAVLS